MANWQTIWEITCKIAKICFRNKWTLKQLLKSSSRDHWFRPYVYYRLVLEFQYSVFGKNFLIIWKFYLIFINLMKVHTELSERSTSLSILSPKWHSFNREICGQTFITPLQDLLSTQYTNKSGKKTLFTALFTCKSDYCM